MPSLFPPKSEFLNFDWTDIANGTGYETYYGARGDNGKYIASPIIIPSEEITTDLQNTAVAITYTKYFDLDFDILFNASRNIFGKLLATVPMGIDGRLAVAHTFSFKVIVKAYHVTTGAAETLLATGTSKSTSVSIDTGGINHAARTHLCICDITTQKHFKKGEKLRITVEGWYDTTADGPWQADLIIAHDPTDRVSNDQLPEEPGLTNIRLANEVTGGGAVVNLSTKMIFQVPFKIEV